MISILASPKPWLGMVFLNQDNAVRSWLVLHQNIEVILYGDTFGTAEACRRLGVRHVPDIASTPEGVPYFGAIADHAAKYARYDLQCYVNCDILFTKSLLKAIKCVPFKRFILIGQRIDLSEGVTIDVKKYNVFDEISNLAERGLAQLHPPAGSDYFVFPRGIWAELPDIIIGRGGYDNVLIAACLQNNIPIIDSTFIIAALHCFHDYGHIDGGIANVFSGSDARINYLNINDLNGISLEDSDWRIDIGGLKRNRCRGDWARYLVLRNTIKNKKKCNNFLQISKLIRSVAYKCGLSKPLQPNIDEIISSLKKNE